MPPFQNASFAPPANGPALSADPDLSVAPAVSLGGGKKPSKSFSKGGGVKFGGGGGRFGKGGAHGGFSKGGGIQNFKRGGR